MQTTPDTGRAPETTARPEPTLAAKVASAVVVLLFAVVVWRTVEIRNAPPPPSAENYKLFSK
jgi:hypothetical protein